MIKQIAILTPALLATGPALAHTIPVDHAHAGGLTLYAMPALIIFSIALIAGISLVSMTKTRAKTAPIKKAPRK